MGNTWGKEGDINSLLAACLSQRQLRSQMHLSSYTRAGYNQPVHRESIQLFWKARAQGHTDHTAPRQSVTRKQRQRCAALRYQWSEQCRLAQRTFGMSKSWVRRSPKACLRLCTTKPRLHCRTPHLLDRVETTERPVGLDRIHLME